MKKSLLALVIASTLPMAAFADVVVYGKANVSLQNADENDDKKIELLSNASRIGVKGGEEISSGLKAIYQFEYQTEVDDGEDKDKETFSQRNIYVGLQGSGGTVMAGMFDTPTKVAQEKIDLFNDLEGDLKTVLNGENRSSNIVQYTSPTFGGGIAASVAYVTKEKDDVDNGISASVSYTSSAFYAALAMDKDVEVDEVDDEGIDILRAVARYTFGPVQLGAMYETYDDGATDEDGVFVSALWNLTDKWAVKAQVGQSDMKTDGGETMSVGADYKLSKNATLFGYYTNVANDLAEIEDDYRDDNYIGVGMELKF